MSQQPAHHEHDHGHAEIEESGRPGYYETMETAVRELLVERHLIDRKKSFAKSRYWTPARRRWAAK